MIYISYNLSSPHFNLLRVTSRCFSWSSVSDNLFFSSSSFLALLSLSFFRLVVSLSFLCYSISEALFALSFYFLIEHLMLLFVHAKAALAYGRNF